MEAVGALGSNVFWYLWQSVQETGVMLTSWGETKRNQEKEGRGGGTRLIFHLVPFGIV